MRNIALNFSRKTKSTFGLDTIALVSVRIYVYICTATCWNVTASGRNVLNKAFIWIPASFCFFRILTKAGLVYNAVYRGEQLGSLSETNSKCSPPVFRICDKISQFLTKDKNELGSCLVRLAAVRDNVSDFEEKKMWCCFILFVWIVVRSNEGKRRREKKMGCCLISFVWIALFPVAIPMKEQLLGRRPNTITLAKVFFPVDQSTQKTNSKPNMMNTISIPHLCSTLS